jgi:hypothetical protein
VARGKEAAGGKDGSAGKEKPEPVIDIFHLHEALHMADYFARTLHEALAEHPAVKNRPEWLALCEEAGDALGKLHQMIGTAKYYAAKAEEGEKS